MNITVIITELLIMFLIFAFLVIGLLFITPLSFISDYPPEIQEAYYKSQHKEAVKEKLNAIMLVKKVVALIAFMFIFAWMLHLAGAKTFIQGLLLTYVYALALFAWDTFFLDWVLFANIKKIRLPGTEQMLMYGKEASNRKQEIDRQHYTIPNQRPKDKHCGKI